MVPINAEKAASPTANDLMASMFESFLRAQVILRDVDRVLDVVTAHTAFVGVLSSVPVSHIEVRLTCKLAQKTSVDAGVEFFVGMVVHVKIL